MSDRHLEIDHSTPNSFDPTSVARRQLTLKRQPFPVDFPTHNVKHICSNKLRYENTGRK
jgi:hypothetical protein